jgi:hypothetical protein
MVWKVRSILPRLGQPQRHHARVRRHILHAGAADHPQALALPVAHLQLVRAVAAQRHVGQGNGLGPTARGTQQLPCRLGTQKMQQRPALGNRQLRGKARHGRAPLRILHAMAHRLQQLSFRTAPQQRAGKLGGQTGWSAASGPCPLPACHGSAGTAAGRAPRPGRSPHR